MITVQLMDEEVACSNPLNFSVFRDFLGCNVPFQGEVLALRDGPMPLLRKVETSGPISDRRSLFKQCQNIDSQTGNRLAGRDFPATHRETVLIDSFRRTPVDFEAAIGRVDEPEFAHLRLGVEWRHGSILSHGGDGDLDDEQSGGRMLRVILKSTCHHRDVRFGFGIGEGDGRLLPDPMGFAQRFSKMFDEQVREFGVVNRLAHLLNDDASDEFRPLGGDTGQNHLVPRLDR